MKNIARTLIASTMVLAMSSAFSQTMGDAPTTRSPDRFAQLAVQDVMRLEYEPHRLADRVVANNRALGLRGVFDSDGLRLQERLSGDHLITMRLESYGRSDRRITVGSPAASVDGQRIQFDHGDLKEWFLNSSAGLEQGFDIAIKPAGEGALELHIDTDLVSLGLDDSGASMHTGSHSFRYSKLKAWDATGKTLGSSMRIEQDNIVLVVDDHDAVYPIVVDPLLSSVSDGNLNAAQAAALFGYDLANVGDVNGDGFEDLVVTAYGFDGTVGANEGGWFLYLGGATVDILTDGSGLGLQAEARLGSSVSGLGDVNGDGYADFAVGAEQFDFTGQADSGRAYLYLGSSNFDSSPDATFQEIQAGGNFGSDIAQAGDLNGDGFSDIAIGAKNYDGGATDSGAVFVYFGGASVNNVADATLTSNLAGIRVGTGVDGAGDFNGDSFADLLVGAPEFESATAEANEGLALLYLGGTSFNTVANASFQINQAQARLGESVAGIGDVNADGFSDIVVGARLYDGAVADSGGAFVYFGAANPAVSPVPNINVENGQANSQFGAKVASGGDFNGDGYADFLVGAPSFQGGSTNEGAIYVYPGSAVISSTAYRRLESNQVGAGLGQSLGAGDFNGDGYSDVYAGAFNFDGVAADTGRVDIYFGGANAPDTVREATILSNQSSAQLGRAVATGDVNGDGFADLITGESGFDVTGLANAGRILIFHGGASGFNATADDSITGGTLGERLGTSLAVGDLNGDGLADILAGAPDYSNGQSMEGAVQIYYANASGLFASSPNRLIEGEVSGAKFGSSVAIAGDINGDGTNDIVVGAPNASAVNLADEGAIYVYLNRGGFSASANGSARGAQAGALFGGAVAAAGDVNGDGFADFMAGANSFDTASALDAGQMRLFHGSAVLNMAVAFSKDGGNVSGRFGSCLAHTDLDGDGLSDVLVGAPDYPVGIASQSGVAFVYLGTISGLNPVPVARAEMASSQTGANFATACAGAGDVNGDGLGDVIFGAPGLDVNFASDGAAFVYYGMKPFTNSAPIRVDVGQSAGAASGSAVAGADFNGDGYADFSIGAVFEDNGGTVDAGAVSVLYGNTIGRATAARTTRSTAAAQPVDFWGDSGSANRFEVSAALYSSNRFCQQARLQVQTCAAGIAFGDGSCGLSYSDWTPVVMPSTRVQAPVTATVGLFHWRARAQYRECSGATPISPRVGPWRRMQANANVADVRLLDAMFKNGFE